MGLQKEKITSDGTKVTYWIAQPQINPITKKTGFLMLGFIDKATRDAGYIPVIRENCIVITDGIYLIGEDSYAAIKQSIIIEDVETNWFADAIDVLEE